MPAVSSFVAYKFADVGFEYAFLHDVVCHECGRHHCGYNRDDDITPDLDVTFAVNKAFLLELHHSHSDVCGKADEHGVDEEQVKCTEKIIYVARGDAEAGGTERRHQCSCDGYARHHIAFAFLWQVRLCPQRRRTGLSTRRIEWGRCAPTVLTGLRQVGSEESILLQLSR